MPHWVRIASTDEIPVGSGKEFAADGRMIALFNVDGEFYAMDGVCPHAGGPLGNGQLTGNVVTCPWHGWQFDVTTGRHCLNANLSHATIPLRVENHEILADLT